MCLWSKDQPALTVDSRDTLQAFADALPTLIESPQLDMTGSHRLTCYTPDDKTIILEAYRRRDFAFIRIPSDGQRQDRYFKATKKLSLIIKAMGIESEKAEPIAPANASEPRR